MNMNKIKITQDCKAYVSLGVIKKFKKGKTYEVNDFIYKSFLSSARGEAFNGEVDFINNEATKTKKSKEKKTPQEEIGILKKEILELEKTIKEQEGLLQEQENVIEELKNKEETEETEEIISDEELEKIVKKMSKREIRKYCEEKYEVSLSEEFNKNQLIKKIMEVHNESIE